MTVSQGNHFYSDVIDEKDLMMFCHTCDTCHHPDWVSCPGVWGLVESK